jgi:hypothetical protein
VTTTPTETKFAPTKIEGMPPAGPGRFWHAVHNPASETKPVRLELRESSLAEGKPVRIGFSRLIGKRSTIADEKQLIEAAQDLLTIVGRVDEFVGVLNQEVTAR